ncbi:enoyl-CoA hydratase family protein [Mycolicibacterium baixiangningiae]|uniref:enoyl-CoA hydratase family protein n=1 Tax=Mycolicibacterium baixiangningiae TaxID=2761578 RepID=UPI0018D106E6|nr:enoyl-CoA hydratase family protein [Mycolicibacterium baixiangningiae]
MPTLVQYAVDGPVARLTLDSPHNRNALSTTLLGELREGLTAAAEDPDVRVAVLGHTGGTFCAGVDLAEVTSDRADEAGVEHMYDFVNLLRQIVELPVPVIAAINGHVRAGGLGLTAACDIAVAGPASTFALTEVRIGVGPAIISLTLLPKLDPRGAGRYYLTGEKFGAAEAADIGLVTVAADDVEASVSSLAAELAKGSPQGLRASKALVTAPILEGFDRKADELVKGAAHLFLSEEAREGIAAFREKRQPSWI